MTWRRSRDRPRHLDVRVRHGDVVRIARTRAQWRACIEAGWHPEDLAQEVYCRVLARQESGTWYDPRRSGVGHYLSVLTSSILANLLAMRRTAKVRREVLAADPWKRQGGPV